MLIMKDYVFRMVDEEVELCSKIVKLSCFLADYDKAGRLPEYKKIAMKEQLDAMNMYFDKLSERIKMEFEEERTQKEEAAENKYNYINCSEVVDEQGNHWIDPRYPISNLEK